MGWMAVAGMGAPPAVASTMQVPVVVVPAVAAQARPLAQRAEGPQA